MAAFISQLLDLLGFSGEPATLPVAPTERPNVTRAVAVLAAAETAHGAAKDQLAAAEQALADHRATAAERLLASLGDAASAWLDAGAAGELKAPTTSKADAVEGRLVASLAEAQRGVVTAEQAVALARTRHTLTLAEAKATFTAEIQPLVRAGMDEVRRHLGRVVELNDALRALAQHAFKNGADLPSIPNEIALPIPTAQRLAEIDERRAGLFASPAAMPEGLVRLRWLVNAMPYAAGEVAAIPLDDAAIAVKSLLAEPVDPKDHKRLKTKKILRLTGDTKVKITKPFTPRQGAVISSGAVVMLDGMTASRAINLGYAEEA